MTFPKVVLTQLDGGLGVSVDTGAAIAIVGPAPAGPAVPTMYYKTSDATHDFTSGSVLELAAYLFERVGNPLILQRIVTTAVGTPGTISKAITGTSTPTIDNLSSPTDDYDPYVQIANGGTSGTAGITYYWSTDAGRTLTGPVALGTTLSITLPITDVFKFDLTTAQTLVAGDNFGSQASGPVPTVAELNTALAALGASNQWICAVFTFPLTAAHIVAIDAWLVALAAKQRNKWAVGNFRRPLPTETDATYQTAFQTAVAGTTSLYVGISAGVGMCQSSISRFLYARPGSWAAAYKIATTEISDDLAVIGQNLQIPGWSIRDANGNPVPGFHDEYENPGLDAMQAITLRSVQGYPGVFITNGNLLTPPGSDFSICQYRRIMNTMADVLYTELVTRLSVKLKPNPQTGFIDPGVATDIEDAINAVMETELVDAGHVASVKFTLSRTDNFLSTHAITFQYRCVPLGYPKVFTGTMAFNNPASRATIGGTY